MLRYVSEEEKPDGTVETWNEFTRVTPHNIIEIMIANKDITRESFIILESSSTTFINN